MNFETHTKPPSCKIFICNSLSQILRFGGGIGARLLRWMLPLVQKISEKIGKYFQPSEEVLKDEKKLHAHAAFLLDAMTCGAVLVRELDEKAKNVFLPDGIAVFEIEETKTARCLKISNGKIILEKNILNPDVKITFSDPWTIVEASHQKLDSMAAIGLGRIKITGLIPLAENLDLVMNRIGVYLKTA